MKNDGSREVVAVVSPERRKRSCHSRVEGGVSIQLKGKRRQEGSRSRSC